MIDFLFALIVPIALMWVTGLGCGLALERVLGLRLPNALVLPLGMCLSIVLIYPGYVAGAGDGLAVALVVAVTAAGLVFARDGLRGRAEPGLAGHRRPGHVRAVHAAGDRLRALDVVGL